MPHSTTPQPANLASLQSDRGNILGRQAPNLNASSLARLQRAGQPSQPGGGGGGDYDSLFQESMGKARSSVEAQLRNAFGEIGRAEQAGLAAVGQLPGQYDNLYDLAAQQTQQFGADADAATAAAGIPGTAGGSAALAPFNSAMAMGRATQQAGVPLLRMAVQGQAAQQRGGLQQTRLSALAGVDDEQRRYQASRVDRESQNAREDMLRREQYEREDRIRQEDRDHDLALAGSKPGNKKGVQFGAQEVSVQRGAALTKTDIWKRNSAYRKLSDEFQKDPPQDAEDIYLRLDKFRKKNPKADSRALSMALFDLYGLNSGL